MSDVLVRNMKMPKNCEECDLSKTRHSSLGDIIDCKYIGTAGSALKDPYNILNTRHPNCPLVEIKTPHGRIGDLDKLKSKFRHGDGDSDVDSAWISAIRRLITQADTIIEAEGSE